MRSRARVARGTHRPADTFTSLPTERTMQPTRATQHARRLRFIAAHLPAPAAGSASLEPYVTMMSACCRAHHEIILCMTLLHLTLRVHRVFPSTHGTPNRTGAFNTMTSKELFSFDLNG